MKRSISPGATSLVAPAILSAVLFSTSFSTGLSAQQNEVRGEKVHESAISPLVLESMDVVRERAKTMPAIPDTRGLRNGRDGRWFVPPISAKTPVHSGKIAVVNEWGDLRIGIGFGELVDLRDLFVAGHGVAPARSVQFVGFRAGKEVERSEWVELGTQHARIELGFDSIDRVEVLAVPHSERMGFYAIDDLRFAPAGTKDERTLDFEDVQVRQVLTGTEYAGLTWESGSGFRTKLTKEQIVPAPQMQADSGTKTGDVSPAGAMNGTAPRKWDDFVGVTQGDPGATLVPPDTCGANGPNHYVVIVNANISAFRKSDRRRVVNSSLRAFWPGSSGLVGDPRIVFDPHSNRYIALATNFTGRIIYLAMSATTDPAGSWFKWSVTTSTSSAWPDYPTLGVDRRGIYMAAYMVRTGSMTVWAIDKAPLLANPPRVGTTTVFTRTQTGMGFEGAVQPCTTYGDPGAQYFVSRRGSTSLRIGRIRPPLTAPTWSSFFVSIPSHSSAPSAPALGSTTPISTIDSRPMNAVFRGGSLYTAHNINVSGRAGVRWYQIGVAPATVRQVGTIGDSVWHYYYGSIAVDSKGNIGLGFSGSHAAVYASTFIAGRLASDPPGQTSKPELVAPGTGPWNRRDGAGRNRFGDYSHIDVDAVDDVGFWTCQEYIFRSNVWRTRVTRFGYESTNYGTGLAGRIGVPFLRTAGRPAIGTTVRIEAQNSSGSPSGGLLILGIRKASIPVFGGTLLVNPLVNLTLAFPASQVNVDIRYPNDRSLVCQPLYAQSAQLDRAATQGFAFSEGLEIRPSSR